MREIGEALRLLFGKLADFLDVFDLSFLISGGVAFLAFLYVWIGSGAKVTGLDRSDPSLLLIGLMMLLLCYVSGLLCFASGRYLRRLLQAATAPWYSRDVAAFVDERLDPVVRGHDLHRDPRYRSYFEGERASRFLYVRMWAELRHDPRREPSLNLLNRYWKLAAAYDGLAAASMLWGVVLVTTSLAGTTMAAAPLPPPVAWGFAALTIISFLACCLEAKRYDQYQLEELVAAMAAEPRFDALDQRWDPRRPLPPLASLLRDPRER